MHVVLLQRAITLAIIRGSVVLDIKDIVRKILRLCIFRVRVALLYSHFRIILSIII